MTKEERRKYIKTHRDCLIVSIGITVIFILFGVFKFNGFIGRLIESVRDLGLSAAYYICDVFELPLAVIPTVNQYPKIPYFNFLGGEAPEIPVPKEFLKFAENWGVFWELWKTKDNFLGYLSAIGDFLIMFSKLIVFLMPLIVVFRILFVKMMSKKNNDYNADTKALKDFKRILNVTYRPVKQWILRFNEFIRHATVFFTVWVIIWLCYFNIFTILIEAVAYYLYFIVSFDVANLYRQFYKLLLDLWGLLTFFPLAVWLVAVVVILNKIGCSVGYKRLRHNEAKNGGVVSERGVVTIVYGEMGAGKTALITDMALSENNLLRDQAFEIILECDLKFPNFPWIILENELKRCFEFHTVFSLFTVREWIKKKKERFNKSPERRRIFDYDFECYEMKFDDKLKTYDIWEILEQYACAYLIYTVESSYIISSYSIRSDTLLKDIGNFPLYDKDFFERDSSLQDSYSRHSHILDFDMLRLGKVMLENNPFRKAFGFGVYVISEIDKERKNTVELQEVKRGSEECNQKNDLFNCLLKIARHPCVVANRVFIKVFADLQRPSSLGADARELGQVVYIQGQTDITPVLPFYSPFWTFEMLYLKLYDKFTDIYPQYRYSHGDNTLLIFIYKHIVSFLAKYYHGVYNTFGCSTMKLILEDGSLSGEKVERRWFKMPKKIYSARYCTDCFSAIFDMRGQDNAIGIDDIPEFSTLRATWAELQLEHSFFQRDLDLMCTNSNNNGNTVVTDVKAEKNEPDKTVEPEPLYDYDEILNLGRK